MTERIGTRSRWARLLGIGLIAAAWLSAEGLVSAKDDAQEKGAVRSSRATRSSRSASEEGDVEGMLARVLRNQEAILKRFDEVMKELQVVKIRASMRSGN